MNPRPVSNRDAAAMIACVQAVADYQDRSMREPPAPVRHTRGMTNEESVFASLAAVYPLERVAEMVARWKAGGPIFD